jgi:hypothetical protein
LLILRGDRSVLKGLQRGRFSVWVKICPGWESNPRSSAYKADALISIFCKHCAFWRHRLLIPPLLSPCFITIWKLFFPPESFVLLFPFFGSRAFFEQDPNVLEHLLLLSPSCLVSFVILAIRACLHLHHHRGSVCLVGTYVERIGIG